jgi:hypothetical protein
MKLLNLLRKSPWLKMFCALFKQNVLGSLYFADRTMSGTEYLDILEEFLMPISEEESPDDTLFQ